MPFEPIAIVGASGLLPGAPDLAHFWKLIQERRWTGAPVPEGRWPLPYQALMARGHVPPDHLYHHHACLLDPFEVDLNGLNVDPKLLPYLDPLFHLMLHVGGKLWRELPIQDISPARQQVILANIALPTDGSSELSRQILGDQFERVQHQDSRPVSLRTSPWNHFVTGMPAALMARALGITGGSYTLDAACASSLYAMTLSCEALQSRRADVVLSGGASRPQSLYTQVGFCQLRALSTSGVCKPFHTHADGLVVGEGAVFYALMRLEDARSRDLPIWGVIRGAGLSNDVGGSLLAPDSEGQLRAMAAAYQQAQWSPDSVSLIECHGTGTPRGDVVELRSLKHLWRDASPDAKAVIGSVKSNVGHLLTGAGAAGLAKVLMSLRDGILPPSATTDDAVASPELHGSPFSMPATPQPWPRSRHPRRAAVSAFGFGGINAHLLVEPGPDEGGSPPLPRTSSTPASPPGRYAITGLAACVGGYTHLDSLREAWLKGESGLTPAIHSRWYHTNTELNQLHGAWISEIDVPLGRFRLPPSEIPSLLPQQLLMLKVAADALDHSCGGSAPRDGQRLRTGVVVGMGLDAETNRFFVGWHLRAQLKAQLEEQGLSEDEVNRRVDEYVAAFGPGLDAPRTLGALGGMISSRVARELRCGGPSFTVSAEDGSGLRALEVAIRLLDRGDVDEVIVGAVDLPGDIRAVLATHALWPWSRQAEVRPFDSAADGSLPGEGAAAIVLRRASDAERDKVPVFAVVTGLGTALGGGVDLPPSLSAVTAAIQGALTSAGVDAREVGLVEAHGSGCPAEDQVEGQALCAMFGRHGDHPTTTLSSAKTCIGHVGAAAGLLGLIKAALCLHTEVLPPLPSLINPRTDVNWAQSSLFTLRDAWPWLVDKSQGVRRALVTNMSHQGDHVAVILEEAANKDPRDRARLRPLGDRGAALVIFPRARVEELRQEVTRWPTAPVEQLAAHLARQFPRGEGEDTVALVVSSPADLSRKLDSLPPQTAMLAGGMALLFPGSGAHYPGMGRELWLALPALRWNLEQESPTCASQVLPWHLAPYQLGRPAGWEDEALGSWQADPAGVLLSQVSTGILIHDALRLSGIKPDAVVGYSLGETTGLLATRTWRNRDELLTRTRQSPLFQQILAGDRTLAREHLGEGDWEVAVLTRSAAEVEAAQVGSARLLIENAPGECVVGGLREDVRATADRLGLEVLLLAGVPTVHHPMVNEVADAYQALHHLETTPPEGISFYGSAHPEPLGDINADSAARALLATASRPFHFPPVVESAYTSGIRFFVEVGPGSSLTRLVGKILEGKTHHAVAAWPRTNSPWESFLRALASLAERGVCVDPGPMWAGIPPLTAPVVRASVRVEVGGKFQRTTILEQTHGDVVSQSDLYVDDPLSPEPEMEMAAPEGGDDIVEESVMAESDRPDLIPPVAPPTEWSPPLMTPPTPWMWVSPPMGLELARAHALYMEWATQALAQQAAALSWQAWFLSQQSYHHVNSEYSTAEYGAMTPGPGFPVQPDGVFTPVADLPPSPMKVLTDDVVEVVQAVEVGELSITASVPRALDYNACMEFAIGKIGKALGPLYAEADTFPTRVRLPDVPLMLVDRITHIEGEPLSLGRGRVVTEHDVKAGDWYLDGGRAPVSISVESGQADLFLCAFLGIDLMTRGERTYRLLDAQVSFHRDLPRVGETITYDIHIDKFVQQGDTWLFFFHFEGYIGDEHLISMREGCAGFFSPEQLDSGRGVVTELTTQPPPRRVDNLGMALPPYRPLLPLAPCTLDDAQLDALRQGDLQRAFGREFARVTLAPQLRLPTGRMHLIQRILKLDPAGGSYRMGTIEAESDVKPDDWYLTCHFSDDPVMPGTLMYECCMHTLRVLLLRLGWVGGAEEGADVHVAAIPGIWSRLKCRGQVTPRSQKIIYRVDIKELGYDPAPYARADALMFVDGKRAVLIEDMCLRMEGLTRAGVETVWAYQPPGGLPPGAPYDRRSVLEFAVGAPSRAFGLPYEPFDIERRIARLPGPPFCFLDQVREVKGKAFGMEAGSKVHATYHVPPKEWYFAAGGQATMPFSVLLEIALQPCGWLAGYAGAALTSEEPLRFRNLEGEATLLREIGPDVGKLDIFATMTDLSRAGGMILQRFEMEVADRHGPLYQGWTRFGFFPPEALAAQVGIRGAEARLFKPEGQANQRKLPGQGPATPELWSGLPLATSAQLPGACSLFLQEVEDLRLDSGPRGLGYIRAGANVDPSNWFFNAHFFQDPVMPGSMGLEAFLTAVKVWMEARFPSMLSTHRFQSQVPQRKHGWIYRGQVIPSHGRVRVHVWVTEVIEGSCPQVQTEGFLEVDGRIIYEMKEFTVALIPIRKDVVL